MSEYGATVAWHLPPQASFDYETFDRSHEWTFAGGEVVQASGSPEYFGTASRVRWATHHGDNTEKYGKNK